MRNLALRLLGHRGTFCLYAFPVFDRSMRIALSVDLVSTEYPGAQGISGLWRRCKTPMSMTCAQSPVKQERSFVRMRSPWLLPWGDVTSFPKTLCDCTKSLFGNYAQATLVQDTFRVSE